MQMVLLITACKQTLDIISLPATMQQQPTPRASSTHFNHNLSNSHILSTTYPHNHAHLCLNRNSLSDFSSYFSSKLCQYIKPLIHHSEHHLHSITPPNYPDTLSSALSLDHLLCKTQKSNQPTPVVLCLIFSVHVSSTVDNLEIQ